MKQFSILVNDSIPQRNWKVLAIDGEIAWLHLSEPRSENHCGKNYDVSTIFEVNITSNIWKKLHLVTNPYVLWDFYVNDKFIYISLLSDCNNDGMINDEDYTAGVKLIRIDRQIGNISELWTFINSSIPFIAQVVDDNFILLNYIVKDEHDQGFEQYSLLDLANGCLNPIYTDEDGMIDAQIFLSKGENEIIYIIKDLHITPSDKLLSNGKPDRIIVECNINNHSNPIR